MRPYLAIIKDSFREALASRVLWVLVGLITLVLAAAAPLTYRQEATVGLRMDDVDQWPAFVVKLREGAKSTRATPAHRIWTLLTEAEQKTIEGVKLPSNQPTLREVRDFQRSLQKTHDAVKRVILLDNFYDPDSWKGVGAGNELKQLQKKSYDSLTKEERQRFNRLLLEAAFPDFVMMSPATSFRFRYLVWDMGFALPIRKQDLADGLNTNLPWLIDKGILSIGLLIAILVTAPIIPQTLDPGSIHLLLSKPIARPLLYLSKFLGGCAFVLMSSAYLFFGMWLILGTRLGIWEPRILWCILIYTFVFAVYYSVAALAGLIWRNTIVAVMIAIAFWTLCFLIGTGKTSMENTIRRYRIARIVPVGKDVLCCDELNTLLRWDEENLAWKPVFASPEQEQVRMALMVLPEMLFRFPPPMSGPVYDEKNQQVASATISFKALGRPALFSAKKGEKGWKLTEGPPAPGQPIALLHRPGDPPLLVTPGSIHQILRGADSSGPKLRLPGFTVPLGRSEAVDEVTPDPPPYWGSPAAAALDQTSGTLAVYSRGTLQLLAYDKGSRKFKLLVEKKLPGDEGDPAVIALGGSTCGVFRKDGSVLLLDGKSLETRREINLATSSPPRTVLASPDGRWIAILLHDGQLRAIDTQSDALHTPPVRGQGDISAIAFDDAGSLLVADRATRVTRYESPTLKVSQTLAARLDFQERGYYYGAKPLYAVLPKPGEFYKTVQYLLTKQKTSAKEGGDLALAQSKLNPWSPVWSSAAFIAVMLGLGCLYMSRQEF